MILSEHGAMMSPEVDQDANPSCIMGSGSLIHSGMHNQVCTHDFLAGIFSLHFFWLLFLSINIVNNIFDS